MINNLKLTSIVSNPIQLIWCILVLGLFTGIVTVSIVWNTRQNIIEDRHEWHNLNSKLAETKSRLKNRLADEQLEISSLLTGQKISRVADSPMALIKLVEQYQLSSERPEFSDAFRKLFFEIENFERIKQDIEIWFQRYNQVRGKRPTAYGNTKSSIHKIQQLIQQIMGKQRLAQALKIRKYRQISKRTPDIAHTIITDLGQATNLINLDRDINDLVLLTEQLFAEQSLDQLADLKDNKLLTILSRLFFSTNITALGKKYGQENFSWLLLKNFLREIFGQGYVLDFTHQTIILGDGGFFGLQQEWLRLDTTNKLLHSELIIAENHINNAIHDVDSITEKFFARRAIGGEYALTQAWRKMIFICVITMLLFLIISSRGIQIIKQQILTIKDANTELEKQAQALHRSEATLKGIFRSAPTGIAKINQKIFEWTNEQMQAMVGYTGDELQGQRTSMLYPSEQDFQNAEKKYSQLIVDKGKGVIETRWQRKDQSIINVLLSVAPIDSSDLSSGIIGTALDISERKTLEEEREQLIKKLQETLDEIKTLSGFIPICASCKKIRDDQGYWNKIESYIMAHSDAEFSHSVCPDCIIKLYPEFADAEGNVIP